MPPPEAMPEAPPSGSTRNWNVNARRVAEELERVTREWGTPVRASTYEGHGRTGEAYGIDLWIEDFRQKADAASERIGDRIQRYVDANSRRLGIAYEIYWGWMREHPGAFLLSSRKEWFDYRPHAREWNRTHPNADDDQNTLLHEDHYHLQILVGHVYRAPNGGTGEPSDDEKIRRLDDHFRGLDAYPWVPYRPIGETIMEVCRDHTGEDNLWVSTGAALVKKESLGRKIFGCDWGVGPDRRWVDNPPFCQVEVTKDRVGRLIKSVKNGGGQNGVGECQLTTLGYVLEAEKLGGAHIAKNNMIVGFRLLNRLLGTYDYLNALEAYNDGNGRTNNPHNPYDVEFARIHRQMKDLLN